jgi:DNA processing protein
LTDARCSIDPEFDAWFRLAHSPGVGRDAARSLLAALGSASAVWAAGEDACRQLVPARIAAALFRPAQDSQPWLTAARHWLEGGSSRGWLTLGDSLYPQGLLQTADPPLLLYTQGEVHCLTQPALAIVGSRRPTPAGAQNARAFAKDLSSRGWLVVSGLATGIDAAAHEGALQAGGPTLAVVGTGLDQVYPPQNADLARRIAGRGLLISEYPPGTPAKAAHFPQRNRILAGLSQGVLVVEAALRSGSLITARLATEAGREVFAIPGSIHSPQAKGCHELIKQGAKLVESCEDILEELQGSRPRSREVAAETLPSAVDQGSSAERALLDAMGYEPASLDALCARLGWPVAELSARLLECELRGAVARLPGGLYQRMGRG